MKYLTTATSQPEAEMMCLRLQAAGIVTVTQGLGLASGSVAASRTHDIYVDEKDLDSARELLTSSEGISEAELVEAEEADAAARAAARPIPSRPGGSVPASAHKHRLWAKLRGRSQ